MFWIGGRLWAVVAYGRGSHMEVRLYVRDKIWLITICTNHPCGNRVHKYHDGQSGHIYLPRFLFRLTPSLQMFVKAFIISLPQSWRFTGRDDCSCILYLQIPPPRHFLPGAWIDFRRPKVGDSSTSNRRRNTEDPTFISTLNKGNNNRLVCFHQSLAGFRIPWCEFRIPEPRIPVSTSKTSRISESRLPYLGRTLKNKPCGNKATGLLNLVNSNRDTNISTAVSSRKWRIIMRILKVW